MLRLRGGCGVWGLEMVLDLGECRALAEHLEIRLHLRHVLEEVAAERLLGDERHERQADEGSAIRERQVLARYVCGKLLQRLACAHAFQQVLFYRLPQPIRASRIVADHTPI